ncbi:MAG: hypothetical protein OHK0013_22640 [Sandaracinaceae bacterium]
MVSRSALSFVIAPFATGLALGCVTPPGQVTAGGGRCARTAECAPGLACNMGVCTTDLTGLGMGMVPMLPTDAGPVDAPADPDAFSAEDAFVEPVDAYVPPGTDAFSPDAFEPPPDAFSPPVDAYMPPEPDAFVPPVDAFSPPDPDAFVVGPDAFVEPDAAM